MVRGSLNGPVGAVPVSTEWNLAGKRVVCLTVGFYENGNPGEIFITTAKEGSTGSGLMD
jgi:ribonucleoside-diphosphate reductase alpha chain